MYRRATIPSLTMWVFIRSAVVTSRKCEVAQNSEKIWTYSSSRSFKVIYLGDNRERICNFLLVVTLVVSRTVFDRRYRRKKLENTLFSPTGHPILVWRPRSGGTRRRRYFWIKLTPQNYRATLWWKLHYPNFNRFWLIHHCDRQTDGRTGYSI